MHRTEGFCLPEHRQGKGRRLMSVSCDSASPSATRGPRGRSSEFCPQAWAPGFTREATLAGTLEDSWLGPCAEAHPLQEQHPQGRVEPRGRVSRAQGPNEGLGFDRAGVGGPSRLSRKLLLPLVGESSAPRMDRGSCLRAEDNTESYRAPWHWRAPRPEDPWGEGGPAGVRQAPGSAVELWGGPAPASVVSGKRPALPPLPCTCGYCPPAPPPPSLAQSRPPPSAHSGPPFL